MNDKINIYISIIFLIAFMFLPAVSKARPACCENGSLFEQLQRFEKDSKESSVSIIPHLLNSSDLQPVLLSNPHTSALFFRAIGNLPGLIENTTANLLL